MNTDAMPLPPPIGSTSHTSVTTKPSTTLDFQPSQISKNIAPIGEASSKPAFIGNNSIRYNTKLNSPSDNRSIYVYIHTYVLHIYIYILYMYIYIFIMSMYVYVYNVYIYYMYKIIYIHIYYIYVCLHTMYIYNIIYNKYRI